MMLVESVTMELMPHWKDVVYPTRSSWLIQTRENWNVGGWSELNFSPCDMVTKPCKVAVTVVSSPRLEMMGDRGWLNEMMQHWWLKILLNAPLTNTHDNVADDVRADSVASHGSPKRCRSAGVIPSSSRDALASARVGFVYVFESLLVICVLTMFRAWKPFWRLQHCGCMWTGFPQQ
jgi:hypothetical protein